MRFSLGAILIGTLLCAGGFFYHKATTVCPAPLSYTLGELDNRFSLSPEEAESAILEAVSVWEDATGRTLFTPEGEGDLVINFVFDERQALVKNEETFKKRLDEVQGVSDELQNTYTGLVSEYNAAEATYRALESSYTQRLSSYNTKVATYNAQGGASSDVFQALEEERRALESIKVQVAHQAENLNALVTEINATGEKANQVITTYNSSVDEFNATFAGEREFIQGDYQNEVIRIYTYDGYAELVLVLVHELGHALSLDHIENSDSAMHAILKGAPDGKILTLSDVVLSTSDLAEFERVCGKKTFGQNVQSAFGMFMLTLTLKALPVY
jgi:hypothetical protein